MKVRISWLEIVVCVSISANLVLGAWMYNLYKHGKVVMMGQEAPVMNRLQVYDQGAAIIQNGGTFTAPVDTPEVLHRLKSSADSLAMIHKVYSDEVHRACEQARALLERMNRDNKRN